MKSEVTRGGNDMKYDVVATREVLSRTQSRGQIAVIALSMVLGLLSVPLKGQEIRIRVLNGRNGRPVANECLNVQLVPSRYSGLVIPTDKQGVATLRLDGDPDNLGKGRCKGAAVPYPSLKPVGSIRTFPDWYVDCQPYEHVGSYHNSVPIYYQVREILDTGIVAGNVCGTFRGEPQPGELVLFVRPAHWWEAIRR